MKPLTIGFLCLIFSFLINNSSKAKSIDYLKLKDSLYNMCYNNDSASLLSQLKIIQAIDTHTINKNISYYYRDYAFTYYKLYAINSDTHCIKKSIELFKIGYIFDPNNQLLLNDLIIALYLDKKKDEACSFINQYQLRFPKDKANIRSYKKLKCCK